MQEFMILLLVEMGPLQCQEKSIFKDPYGRMRWKDLFRWKQKAAPRFPVSYLHPSHCEKSPTLFSLSPVQRPGTRNSVPLVPVHVCHHLASIVYPQLHSLASTVHEPRLGVREAAGPQVAVRVAWLLWREKVWTNGGRECYGHQR